MDRERWRRVEELYHAAQSLPAGARAQFLADECRGDESLRSEVESLIISNTGVYSMELGSDQRQWLVEAQSLALYVPPGHLLFAREGTLLAQTFDFRTARLSGEPVPVAVPIDHNPTGALASFAVSADGNVLTYRGGFSTATELVRFDGAGVRQGAIGQASDWSDIKLSPDGSRAALVTTGRASGHREIWLVEIATGRLQLWSTERSNDWHPVWSPDGHDLAFASDRSGASAVFRRAVDSSGENNLIAAAAGPAAGRFPEDWSSGDHLVINQDTPNATTEIWLTTASGTGEPRLLKRGGRQTGGGRISPDGRWLAYVSDESGAFEVYVSSLDGSGKYPVSSAGGVHPRWRADGRELLYIGGDRALMSVSVASGDTFKTGSPRRLFASCLTRLPNFYAGGFALGADASTFWLCPGSGSAPGEVTVTVGWLAARLTAGK